MGSLLFRNARLFDGHAAECPDGISVLVADGLVQEVSDKAIKAGCRLNSMPNERGHVYAWYDSRRTVARARGTLTANS